MPLTIWNCVLSYKKKNYFSENQLAHLEIPFRTEFPGSNFLLPTFLTGGKCDFEVADLLLATVNFLQVEDYGYTSMFFLNIFQRETTFLISCLLSWITKPF